ncbi:dihydrofolate reductase family protein [Mucilaginibacter panaciglaebae]|uniref:Dihydrofolate reductase family protein n=1 Tax=Mucilaginibacter panaciglaebae TaxID=502331 RepID=A0ABP7WT55_9SPHI
MSNIVYIATSIDGYIAGKDGDIKWLIEFPNPEGSDYGFSDFIKGIDALIMGRHTFETVNDFDTWMYPVPVFVLSNTLTALSGKWAAKAGLIKGDLKDVLSQLNARGINNIYVDGGKTIQSFLAQDMIDKLIITTIPIVLGGGIPLFGDSAQLKFKHESTDIYAGGLVKNTFIRDRGI